MINLLIPFDQLVALLSNYYSVVRVRWQLHIQSLVAMCQSVADLQPQNQLGYHAYNFIDVLFENCLFYLKAFDNSALRFN